MYEYEDDEHGDLRWFVDQAVEALERWLSYERDRDRFGDRYRSESMVLVRHTVGAKGLRRSLRDTVDLIETVIDTVDLIERAAARAEELSLFPAPPDLERWLGSLTLRIRGWQRDLCGLRRTLGGLERQYWAGRPGEAAAESGGEAAPPWDADGLGEIDWEARAVAVEVVAKLGRRQWHMDDDGTADGRTFDERMLDERMSAEAFSKRSTITLGQIDDGHFTTFEHTVAALLERDGFTVTRVQGGAGDMGGDVLGVTDLNVPFMVQCKHSGDPRATVGQPVVQHALGGARAVFQAGIILIVTNRGFSKPAREFAALPTVGATLIDREMLVSWAEQRTPLAKVLAPQRGAEALAPQRGAEV
ncbi:restriction endonuclease [Kitasatospora sp. NPDC059803]|uniref:restriction endonuclease n=1 Tax=Kitasatospora sp. NPDC059803 TaxID=3346953 RepID=UPI0036567445